MLLSIFIVFSRWKTLVDSIVKMNLGPTGTRLQQRHGTPFRTSSACTTRFFVCGRLFRNAEDET